MPYTRPYAGGFQDFPATTTPIDASALNTMDVGIKTANDQFQTVTTAQRATLTPSVGQAVWDSDLKQLMVYMNASGGNAWQPVGNRIVCASTTRPSSPFEGQEIYETDSQKTLVYDGANWIETSDLDSTDGLPSSAQAKLNAVGLTHILTQTFTTESSLQVNNCFSASFDDYLILLNHVGSTTAQSLNAQWSVGGTPNSTANSYVTQRLDANSSSVVAARQTSTDTQIGRTVSTLRTFNIVQVSSPFLAQVTSHLSQVNGGDNVMQIYAGTHNQTVSYDGFRLAPGSGTFSGTLRIYGYRIS